jgi:CRP-like cAMP-binding protein
MTSIFNKYLKHSTKSKVKLELSTGVHYDSKIQNLLELIHKNKRESYKLFNDNKTLEIIGYILNKSQRNENELKIVYSYLETLKRFISLIGINQQNLKLLLKNISIHLKCEKYQMGKLLFRFGEKGQKFYIILKGSVHIMLLKENKIRLTFYEYILHLIRLYAIGEIGLMQKIIKSNRYSYEISEKEIIEFVDRYNDKLEKSLNQKKNTLLNFDDYDIKKLTKSLQEIYSQITQINLNVSNYIQLTFPFNISEKEYLNFNEKKLIIYSYFEVTKTNQGDFFGEIALEKSNLRRSGSIICAEDCIFGTLSKEAYNNSIREIQIKERRNNVKTLLSFKIFSDLNWDIFQNHFFNLFKIIHVYRNENIVEQGNPIKQIYFVKEGEYEIISELSNFQIDKLILHLKNKYNDKKIKENEYDNDKKRLLKICILKGKDVIGLYDIFDLDNINSAMTVRCISVVGTLYCIEKKIFEDITTKVKNVEINFIKFTNQRRIIMINRLNLLRKTNAIEHIETKEETLFDKLNKIFIKNNEKYNLKFRVCSANAKCKKVKKFSLKNLPKSLQKTSSLFNIKNEKEKKKFQLIENQNIKNSYFKKTYNSILSNNDKNAIFGKNFSYAINTDSFSKYSRNYFSRNLNNNLTGISFKTTNIIPQKIINLRNKLTSQQSEKILKSIVGSSYKKKSNSLNFKPKSKGDIYINKMKKIANSNSNLFVDMLQYDSLYSIESKNNLTVNSMDDGKNYYSKNAINHKKKGRKIKLTNI